MKIKIDIDCSPGEMRDFLGLPDIKALQEDMLGALREQMTEAMGSGDSETLSKAWGPLGLQNMESMQKAFWTALSGSASRDDG